MGIYRPLKPTMRHNPTYGIMHVLINGVRLFFDVEDAKLVPDGPVMREKPTLLLLHKQTAKTKPAPEGAGDELCVRRTPQELAFKTVTARRFCDQHEMSLHTATGRSLP